VYLAFLQGCLVRLRGLEGHTPYGVSRLLVLAKKSESGVFWRAMKNSKEIQKNQIIHQSSHPSNRVASIWQDLRCSSISN